MPGQIGFEVTAVTDAQAGAWDTMVVVSNSTEQLSGDLAFIQTALQPLIEVVSDMDTFETYGTGMRQGC